jgi:hypothetical protein
MGVVQSHVGGFDLILTNCGGATTSARADRGATGDGRQVGGRRIIVLEGTRMKMDKGAKAILVPESRGQVRFQILLNLDLVENIQGVWGGNGTLRTIKRLEVLREAQRESLEVIYTLEGAQQGIGSLVVGPTWVKGLHDLVVLCEERSDRMREHRAKEGLHAEDAVD